MNMKTFKKILTVFMMAALVVIVTGCTTFDNFKTEFITGEKGDVVRIGVFEPLSGTDKELAAKEVEGIELAYGLHPTVDGKKIELVYSDNRSDIDAADTAIQDLIKKNPVMVLGSYGNANSLVAAEYLEEAEIPAITMTNTNPLVTSSNDFYFRVCYVDTYQGTALAQYAYDGLKAKKTAILVPSGDEQAAMIAQKYMNRFISLTDRDSSIAANLEYEPGTSDYAEQLKLIESAGADVVLLPVSTDDTIKILEQAAEQKLDVKFLGIDSWNIEKLSTDISGSMIDNLVFTKVTEIEAADSDNRNADEFFEAYGSIYGTEEIPDSATALGYDAYMIAIEALSEAGSDADGKVIKDKILNLKYKGASGNITFNSKGDPKKSVTIYSLDTETKNAKPIYIVGPDGTGSTV